MEDAGEQLMHPSPASVAFETIPVHMEVTIPSEVQECELRTPRSLRLWGEQLAHSWEILQPWVGR